MSAELNPYHKRDFTYDQQYLIILIRCISCADINQYIRLDVTSYDNDSIWNESEGCFCNLLPASKTDSKRLFLKQKAKVLPIQQSNHV